MFNECVIHLCDCTWLNVLYILNHMLIKYKRFLSIFSCFWKVFCFENFQKIQNFLQLCFSDSLMGQASHKTPIASLHKSSRDSLASQFPSHKKYLENISKFLSFWHFRNLVWRLGREWRLQSRAYIEGFMTRLATYSQVDLLVAKNT